MTEPTVTGDKPVSIPLRAVQALEAWLDKHVHDATVEGRSPISPDEKVALEKVVADAVASTKE